MREIIIIYLQFSLIVFNLVCKYLLTINYLTEKQKKILTIALELIANEGYNVVSTKVIAEQANVSEALIFRHFKNKKGLLEALYQQCEDKAEVIKKSVLEESDPNETIRKAINWVFIIDENEYDFWRLQYKLKWEESFYNPHKMQSVIDKIAWAFEQLEYEQPILEAQLLEKTLDSVMISILRDGKEAHLPLRDFLLKKYHL